MLQGAVVLGGKPGDGIPLPVPRTNPLVISVSSGLEESPQRVDVQLGAGEELRVSITGPSVELRTISGGGMVLRRAQIGQGGAWWPERSLRSWHAWRTETPARLAAARI